MRKNHWDRINRALFYLVQIFLNVLIAGAIVGLALLVMWWGEV